MKKLLIKLLFSALVLSFGISVHAAVIEGECGGNTTYSYDTDTCTLEITGSGAMSDYTATSTNQPWKSPQYTSQIETLVINEGITHIGNYSFVSLSELETVVLPDSLQTIGENAFASCASLSDIEIPNGVTTISGNAFKDCISLENIELPANTTTLGDGVFMNCTGLKNAVLPTNITIIPNSTFSDCSGLEFIKIPDSVTTIKGSAFRNCTNLKNVIIPDGVQIIQNHAFTGCTNLKDIVLTNNTITLASYAFNSCPNLTIHCNANSNAHTFATNKGIECYATLPTQFTVTSESTNNTISIKAKVPATTFEKYVRVELYDSDHKFIGYTSLPSTSFCNVFNIDIARTDDIAYLKVSVWNNDTSKLFAEEEIITLINSGESSPTIKWYKDTDSGCYAVNDKKLGIIRFLFAADTDKDISAFGIKYSKNDEIDKTIDSTTQIGKGNQNAFYGDLTGITDNSTYYAAAFIKIGNIYYWSDVSSCEVDWAKEIKR